MFRRNLFLIVLIASYIPSLLRLTYGTPQQVTIVKFFTDLAFISFFWLIVTGFREGFIAKFLHPELHGNLHIFLATLGFFSIILHPILLANIYGEPLLLIPFAHDFGLLVSLGSIAFDILLLTMVVSYFLLHSRYQFWHVLHYLNYVFFIFVFVHGLGSLILGSPTGIYYIVLFVLGVLTMAHKWVFDLKLFAEKLEVLGIQQVAEQTFMVTLVVPESLLMQWKPGQYLQIARGRWQDHHPFSISGVDYKSKTISFTFKMLGDFTEQMSQELQAGDQLFVSGAYGYLKPQTLSASKSLVFLAGGIGVAPFRSLITDLFAGDPDQEVYLIYAARSPEFLAYDAEFQSLAQQHSNFHYLRVLENGATAADKQGYVTADVIRDFVPDIAASKFFLCGPLPMMKAMKKVFRELGVRESQVEKESFGY